MRTIRTRSAMIMSGQCSKTMPSGSGLPPPTAWICSTALRVLRALWARCRQSAKSARPAYILSLYQDRGGVLWVGTREGGVSHWNPRSWLLGHYFSDAFRGRTGQSFADDGAGKVWVGTMGCGTGGDRHPQRARAPLQCDKLGGDPQLSDDRVMALLNDQQRRVVDRHHVRRARKARRRHAAN